LGKAEVESLLRSGRVLRAEALHVLVKPNGLGYPRLGMIVPKRAVALATRRNRLKRLIREWFRLNQARLSGRDWLVRLNIAPKPKGPRPGGSTGKRSGRADPAVLEQALRAQLDRARIDSVERAGLDFKPADSKP
jgi:ribonuclease P protein component